MEEANSTTLALIAAQKKIERLTHALDIAMKSLATYGSHPIIEQEAKWALEQ